MTRTLQLRGLATALVTGVLLVAPAGLAGAQEGACVEPGEGSAVGDQVECPDDEVLDEVLDERDERDVGGDTPSQDQEPDAARVLGTQLAQTGTDVGDIALVGLGLVALGGSATLVARRRNAAESSTER